MAQWINLNGNNRSVLAHRYSVLGEKTGPILLLLVGLTAGRQASRQKSQWVLKFVNSLQVKLFGLLFCYHSNVTTVLKLHFSRLLSSKAYFKKCEKFISHFFHVNPYY